ncbi:alpha/beta hydrolase-fold protein [Paenibacillus sp. KQZ6P-2]|uniref:Alpha/beta hydrolase-fold protein n=1 Tax=Paenibacillus mangrovi TaxID=2931978 RepID=A0A9X2B3Q1_9BACL|nr:alpha/beta hydrolase-fold protein [Paenibacillus mangrovi]MCJ8013844.1 alpha/beta hydrolase-fold protein [Paenibacillus mangrovi]
MAHITIDTGSPTLRMTTSIHVISPVDTGVPTSSTLYLLHGAGDNASTWHRLTTVELYAAKYSCTVIMPEVNRSYYTDMVYGLDYFYYVTQELPEICGRLLRLNNDPKSTFVAGLSMGGYGALKAALTYPNRYAKAVSLSGVTDIQQRLRDPNMEPGMAKEMQAVFGTELNVKPDQDLYALAAKRIEEGGQLPPVLSCCGTEDPFIKMNREFANYMRATPFGFNYVEGPGTHDWFFWEKHLKTAFDFLFNEKN